MTPGKALDITLRKFDISAKQVAMRSKTAEDHLSKFRHDRKDLSARKLQKVVMALPPEAQIHFWWLFSMKDEEDEGVSDTKEPIPA